MVSTRVTILITGIIMVTFIPCLASQHPDDGDDSSKTGIHSKSTEPRGHDQNDGGDLEGPYTFSRGGHHRRNDRKSGGLRQHGNSEHRASHEHRGRSSSGGSSSREFVGGSSSNRGRCPSGFYLNRVIDTCAACSSCPINQIIRRPCSAHRDTVCGPFYEFQQPQNDQQALPKGAVPAATGNEEEAALAETSASIKSKNVAGGSQGDASSHSKNSLDDGVGQTKGPTVQSNADQWRELCYGLIGALAVVTLLALIYIIITQIQARRHSNKYPDLHGRTVLTPTMRVFANGFLGTTDYQKITPNFDDGTGTSRRHQNWFLRHLKRPFTSSHATPNHYVVTESDVVLPLGAMPEAVEMDNIQVVPQPPPVNQGQGAEAPQGQAGQGHEAHRLESTQSWDSGIGTQEGHRHA